MTAPDLPETDGSVLPEGGSVRPITRWGEPVMHRPQRPVTEFDAELRSLVADMVATMYAADGVGLAACQVGVDLSVFVFDCPDEGGTMVKGVVCNPTLVLPEGKERRLDSDDEGCLSFPGAFVECPRPDRAEVHGQGVDGSAVHVVGTGLLARCLQHETDHCHGTVFGDRLSRRTYKRLQKQHDAATEEYPHDWPTPR
ncbi:MAG TPA: peptide deformylase [Marmoricola sp.]|nr:peptide deformylase [Marmoricola sp.]